MIRLIFVIMILMPLAARAATCDAGYYLLDNKCVACGHGYYCNNDERHACPINNANFTEINDGSIIRLDAPYTKGGTTTAPAITYCIGQIVAQNPSGKYKAECPWNGINYYDSCNGAFLWYEAYPGYYLSDYNFKSSAYWYRKVKACTNAPEYAHYTGAGTPDAPDGSIIDANDCPWECDDGYGLHGNECVPLCGAGIQYIKTGGGLQFNLYPVAYSSPALAIKYNNTICYGVLSAGASQNTININLSGKIYHVEN